MRRKPPIKDDERTVTDPERSRKRTFERAVRLLSAKGRSRRELRERLLEKPWTNAEIVDAVIDKLTEYKFIDDASFARSTALSNLRQKPQGKRRLTFTLSQKKLDRSVVEDAVAAAYDEMSEASLIDEAIAKRIRIKGKPETREDLKKFFDHLMRRGFEMSLIRDRLAEIGNLDD